jgi:glycerate-2-kinase
MSLRRRRSVGSLPTPSAANTQPSSVVQERVRYGKQHDREAEVGKGGASCSLVGQFEAAVDLKAGMVSSFRGDGQSVDFCHLLGP